MLAWALKKKGWTSQEQEWNGGCHSVGGGGNGVMKIKEYKLSVVRRVSSEDLTYSLVTRVNSMVLET